MRYDRLPSYGDVDSTESDGETGSRKHRTTKDQTRAKRRSNRKRTSAPKVAGIGHRRQRKWSW